MPRLKFYDVKTKKSFTTDKYKVVTQRTPKGTRRAAVTKSPAGVESWRYLGK